MASKMIYKWQIQHFSKVASLNGPTRTLKSDTFTLNGKGLKFYLSFEPTDSESEFKDHCSLFLMSTQFGETDTIQLQYKLWLENMDGDKLLNGKVGMTTDTFVKNGYGFGWEVAHHNELYPPQSTFIKHDTVFLCCELRYKMPEPKDDDPQLAIEIQKKEWSFYKEGYQELCTIQVDDQEFSIEKKKLMAHSPVFEAMFKSGMQEEQTDTIVMTDTSPATIQALIQYLHVQATENLSKEVFALYYLADKYQIDDLKKKCSRILIEKLDESTFLDCMILAFRHNDIRLKQELLDCLSAQPCAFKQIMKSVEWIKFTHENIQLSGEIIDKIFEELNWQ